MSDGGGDDDGTEHRETFQVLPGAHVDYGGRFEYLMSGLVALKLMQNPTIKGFKLANNSADFGKFDDLVVETESTSGAVELWATQLKHNKTGKLITRMELGAGSGKGDFSIKKYFKDHQERQYPANTKLLLFTNRPLALEKGKQFKLEGEPFFVTIKESIDACMMNTSADSAVYQLEVQLTAEKVGDFTEYERFFEHFYIYANQKNVQQIEQEISQIFAATYKSDRHDKYVKFFENWCRKEAPKGSKVKLYKEDVGRELGRILLEPHIRSVAHKTNQTSKAVALKTIMLKFDVTLIEEACGELVSNLPEASFSVVSVNETNIDSVYKAIDLLRNTKFILIGDCVDCAKLSHLKVFQSLSDLQSDDYKYVAESFSCVMQGRKETCLGEIVKDDEELKNCFSVGQLLNMVVDEDKFVIGEDTVELPTPYIDRLISKHMFSCNVIKNLVGEVLVVISCSDQNRLLQTVNDYKNPKTTVIDAIDCEKQTFPLILLSNNKCSTTKFNEICSKIHANIFHFEMIEHRLNLLNAHGPLDELLRFREHAANETVKDSDILHNFMHKTNVLLADPGMGKTVCADLIKLICPFDSWPVKVNLREKLGLFRRFDKIEDLLGQILDSHTSLAKRFHNHYRTNKKVLLIWDGVDEVGCENEDLVVDMIESFAKCGYSQWITSRCHLQEKLERSLNVLAVTLTEVTPTDQKNYIYQGLRETYGRRVRTFTDEAHERIVKNNTVKDMLAVPLLLHMFTTICLDRVKFDRILENEITLAQIYSMFIDAKFDHFHRKIAAKDENDALYSKIQDEIKAYRMNQYQKAALRVCFDDVFLYKMKANCDDFLQNVAKHGDVFGIIMNTVGNDEPIFVHKTFAEYFAALYLTRKHRKLGSDIMKRLFRPEYRSIRLFFDLFLSEIHPAHQAVLELDLDKLEKLDTDTIFSKDKGGRNALHLASSYGTVREPLREDGELKSNGAKTFYKTPFRSVKKDNRDYTSIVEYLVDVVLEEQKSVNYKDEIYALNCLEYASCSSSLYAIDAMLRIPEVEAKFQKFVRVHKDTESLVAYSIVLDYKNLFSALKEIPYFELSERVRFYLWQVKDNVIILLVKYGRSDMLAKALKNRVTNRTIDKMFDQENPLSWAVTRNNLDSFKILIQHGADPFQTYSAKNTSILDIAVEKGKIDFVRHIVEEKLVQIERNNFSSLRLACEFGHLDIYNYLIETGADVNVVDGNGRNLLHVACQGGNIEIIEDLVENKNIPLESVDSSNNTPLLTAAHNGHFGICNYLISIGARAECLSLKKN